MSNYFEDAFDRLLSIHEVDRYPSPELSLIKLQEEVGELASAWLEGQYGKVRKEAADVVFALQGFIRIWNIDIMDAMEEVISESYSKKRGKHPNGS